MLDFLGDFLPVISGAFGILIGIFGGKKIGPLAIISIVKEIIKLAQGKHSRPAAEALGVKHGEAGSKYMCKALGKGIWEAGEDEILIHLHHYIIGLRKGANLDD